MLKSAKHTTVLVSRQTVPSPHPNSAVCVQDVRDSLRKQQQEAQTSRKNKEVSRDINEYLIRKAEWILFRIVSFLMFNADPDAAALKWDETWCYTAVLIRRQAHMRICIHVRSLTHSGSSNWVRQLNPSVMLLRQPPLGREETGRRNTVQRMGSKHEKGLI